MASGHTAHGGHSGNSHGSHGRPYLMFWINMALGLIVMYFVMYSMSASFVSVAWKSMFDNMASSTIGT